jgi:xanthine dehydrogenase small subunit
MGRGLEFQVNGNWVRSEHSEPHTTLLDLVRSQGLTGAKEGCAEGECGACTVLILKDLGDKSRAVPVNSCLLLAAQLAGREVWTVEALARSGKLAEVQARIAESGGSQCGYCTPGFVMSLFAEQYRPGRTGPCNPAAAHGNLCRCTGYRPIQDAAVELGPAPDDEFRARLGRGTPAPSAVDGPGFSRPTMLRQCLALLASRPDARIISGGTDLVVESNLRFRRFPDLISVEAIPELRQMRDSEAEIEIGAALPLSEIALDLPVWQEWMQLFASPLIRNRATLGGNLATASPIGDGAPLLLALDARVRIAGAGGFREVPLDGFFLGYRKTALEPGEVLVSIVLPKPFPKTVRFYKAAKRRMDDISTVAACFAVHANGSTRAAYGGVAAVPRRAREVETILSREGWTGPAVRKAQGSLERALQPISDHRGSAAYRLALSQRLLEKFWWQEVEGAAA